MRPALIAGFVAVSLALLGYASVRLMGFEETREYDTHVAAAADDVFAKGWLPPVIPGSATGLVMSRNFDVYTGRGAFRYDPADSAAFVARLRPWQGGSVPFNGYGARAAGMERRGYRSFEFAAAGNIWVFFVNAADRHVEYDMWRDAAYPRHGGSDPP